jgi:hypothetical protein
MKIISSIILFTFSASCYAFDPIDYCPSYVPDFNLSPVEFCEAGIEKATDEISKATDQEVKDYWCGYRDAFRIFYYYFDEHTMPPL